MARAELRRVLAATYHQVWWPAASRVKYDGDELPIWDEGIGGYLDPATGEVLPTWDQALDAIGPDDEPWHVARFGVRFDDQGVLAGSKDAGRCIGYLTKYLTKQVGDCHQADTDPEQAHAARLADALRYQPCSPRCANWLRYGIQPKNARPGLAPDGARARPTTPITSATPGVACWSRASGPARRWPTTAPTAKSGCFPRLVFRQPTRPGTPGNRSPPATRITWTTQGGCCTPWPTVPDGKPRSARPGAERLCPRSVIFRQRERRHDGRGRNDSAFARRERGSPAAWDRAAVRPAPDRGTTDRVSQARPSRAHQRSCPSRVHQGRMCPSGDICPQEGGLMPGKRRFGRVRELPSGRWQARYKGPDGIDRPAPHTFDSKTSAGRWLTLTEAEIIQGGWIDPDAGRVLFGKYATDWIEERPGLRPKTAELYRYLLRRHLAPVFDARPVAEIREPSVRRWRKDLLDAGVSAVTVAKAYRLLKAVFNTAVDDGLIRRNPCRIKGAGQEKAPERPVLTVPQVYALADAADERYRVLVLLAAFTSLRWSELAALRRSDIDIQARTVRVTRQLNERHGGGFAFSPPKSEAGQRTVAIPELITPDLAAHIVTHARPGDDRLVFTSPGGGPLRHTNFRRRFWVPALQAAGLPPIHFHDLRHTGNMLAADAGANLRELMDRMGHSTSRAAMVYLHGGGERQQAIADELTKQAAVLLGRSTAKPSGTQRARRRRTAS